PLYVQFTWIFSLILVFLQISSIHPLTVPAHDQQCELHHCDLLIIYIRRSAFENIAENIAPLGLLTNHFSKVLNTFSENFVEISKSPFLWVVAPSF
ncbi:hypothetical protein ACFWUO_20905, partial [Bacillus subtilis]